MTPTSPNSPGPGGVACGRCSSSCRNLPQRSPLEHLEALTINLAVELLPQHVADPGPGGAPGNRQLALGNSLFRTPPQHLDPAVGQVAGVAPQPQLQALGL